MISMYFQMSFVVNLIGQLFLPSRPTALDLCRDSRSLLVVVSKFCSSKS
jgi:hypothetical protein